MLEKKVARSQRQTRSRGATPARSSADIVVPPPRRAPARKRGSASDSHPRIRNVGSISMADLEGAKSKLDQNFKDNSDAAAYRSERHDLVDEERSHAWDAPARERASPAEISAQRILTAIRERDRVDPNLFGNLPGEALPPEGSLDMGGRFLFNLPRINKSDVFKIVCQMPKGAHQHLHFNSEIDPEYLFPLARELVPDTMFIRSTHPLVTESDLERAEIVFQVLPRHTKSADIFSAQYTPDWRDTSNTSWMLWQEFRQSFLSHIESVKVEKHIPSLDPAETWAREKMIITTQNAYHSRQTHNGAWACFNQGTRAFKGLFGYESAYRWYIGHMIDNMIKDKVMYAEVRPMLMDKTIPTDDGNGSLDHKAQMTILVEEVRKKTAELEVAGRLHEFPYGVKVIYCTPRSIPLERMKTELEDCLALKLHFPDLICGFDLVGAEDRPNSIGYYADLLTAFTKTCKQLGIQIPFMFHAGETLLDTGGSSNPDNSNLYDALLLNAKRIGHGYALLKHPLLVEKYKEHNICLELCPISNELLHLCGNVREHPYPQLLAAGLHCTLNADNPSLFRGAEGSSASLSYEFYQVLVGDPRMSIHGCKQLAEWSLEHSCLSDDEVTKAKAIYAQEWETFCQLVVKTYGEGADAGDEDGRSMELS